MKRKYKALMLDLDGTTIPQSLDGMPSKRIIEAVAKANKKIHVGIVTARVFGFVKDISHELSLSGPSIISGGAIIVDFPSQKIVQEKDIDLQDTKKIIKILQKLKLPFVVQDRNSGIGINAFDENYRPEKAVSIAAREIKSEQADQLLLELKKIPTITAHKTVGWEKGKVWVQICHAEATKQHGIMEVAKILGIETHEIIGVGDGYNDFPLLMACGLKVAMGNAVPELKEIADYVAPSVEEDGVADVIEKFIL